MAADPAGLQLADEIAAHIRAGRLKPGALVASEQELRTRHDIGRSVLRQAMRILQERGVAHMRRGAGGGLIVSPPNPESASRALAIAIESRMQGPTALDRLLKAADTHVFLAATPKLEMAACERVRKLVARLGALSNAEFLKVGGLQQVVAAVRGLVRDPLAGLAYQTTAEYGQDLVPYSVMAGGQDFLAGWWDALLQMVEAQIAGDVAALFDLRRRQQELVADSQRAWSAMERDSRLVPAIESAEDAQSGQGTAERLAREILRDVRLLGWTPGERIGGATALMNRYRVTVGTLRQAVRILEEHAAVRMERGRNGGLVIMAPDLGGAVRRALDYLAQAEVEAGDARFFTQQLMLEALSQIAQTKPDLTPLAAAVDRGADAASVRRLIGQLSGDAALDAFAQIAIAVAPAGQGVRSSSLPVMLQALKGADAPRARRAYLNYELG